LIEGYPLFPVLKKRVSQKLCLVVTDAESGDSTSPVEEPLKCGPLTLV
jgi:hypothetical protein